MNELGSYLKELRGGKSLREVQKGTGISHTYLSTLEKGFDPRTKKERKPAVKVLRKLASYYDVNFWELMAQAGYIPKEDYEKQQKFASHINKTMDRMRENAPDSINFSEVVSNGALGTDYYWGDNKLDEKQKSFIKNMNMFLLAGMFDASKTLSYEDMDEFGDMLDEFFNKKGIE